MQVDVRLDGDFEKIHAEGVFAQHDLDSSLDAVGRWKGLLL